MNCGHFSASNSPRSESPSHFFRRSVPKGITGKVQRSRLNEIVARKFVPDAPSDERHFQFWRTLKQLAAFKRPHPAPRTQQNETAFDMPVLSEARLQAELLLIWKRILKVESLSIDDDFFGKGGNSLLAMDLHVEVQRLTTKPVPELILF